MWYGRVISVYKFQLVASCLLTVGLTLLVSELTCANPYNIWDVLFFEDTTTAQNIYMCIVAFGLYWYDLLVLAIALAVVGKLEPQDIDAAFFITGLVICAGGFGADLAAIKIARNQYWMVVLIGAALIFVWDYGVGRVCRGLTHQQAIRFAGTFAVLTAPYFR